MGVTLYYRGKLKSPENVTDLVAEMTDIANTMRWKYHTLDDPWDEEVTLALEHREGVANLTGNAGLKGIMVMAHPESENLSLLFDKEGVCRSLLAMTDPPEKRDDWAFTKTQFAGIDTHIRLVTLFEYVAARYMREWEIMDDCYYVEHRDRERSLQVFHTIDQAIDTLTEALSTIETRPEGNDPDDQKFFALIEERIRTYLPGVEIYQVRADDEEE